MSNRKARGYQSYGSTKGVWKYAVGLIFAALSGIGAAVALTWMAGRWLPSLAELALYLFALTFGIIGMLACNRAGHFCWAFFLAMLCVFLFRSLTITIRTDILAYATLTGGGARPLLTILCVILTLAIGAGLLFCHNHWVFVLVISIFAVFPTLKNCTDAINVAVDSRATQTVSTEAMETYKREETILLSRSGSFRTDAYYITVGKNSIVPTGTELKVRETLYSSLRSGDSVNIVLHPGALGMPWLEVAAADE